MESEVNRGLLELPAHAKQKIKETYNLDKTERLDEAIDILEDWIKKQDYILKKDFSREYLEKSIVSAKGSVEKAKKNIDRLCTLKTLLPQFFSKSNVKMELAHVPELACLIPLPVVTEDFYRIFIVKVQPGKTLMEHNYMEHFQLTMILTEYVKKHDFLDGLIVIYDQRQINLMDLLTKLNPVQLQQYASIMIEGYGGRLKGIYLLTDSKVVDLFVNTVKPLLGQKLSKRICVFKTLEELHTVVPKDLLPMDYGGKQRSLSDLIADWVEELSTEEHVEYMKMMSKACTDEKLRRADQFNEEYMGMPGSFRNMTVD